MKRIFLTISVVVIFLGVPTILLTKEKAPPGKDLIAVTGTIQCNESSPISRALVYFVGHSYMAITDDWGNFTIYNVLPEEYLLEVKSGDEIIFSGPEIIEGISIVDLGILDLSCSLSAFCSPGENGSQRCNGDIIEICNGAEWTTGEDCSQSGQVCIEPFPDFATCEEVEAECGNGTIEGAEVCDGANLAGETCQSQGYDSGTLACGSTCDSFDISGCSGLSSFCSPGENGSQRCNGDIIEICNGAEWATGEDCSQSGQVCIEPFPDFATCEEVEA